MLPSSRSTAGWRSGVQLRARKNKRSGDLDTGCVTARSLPDFATWCRNLSRRWSDLASQQTGNDGGPISGSGETQTRWDLNPKSFGLAMRECGGTKNEPSMANFSGSGCYWRPPDRLGGIRTFSCSIWHPDPPPGLDRFRPGSAIFRAQACQNRRRRVGKSIRFG